MDTKSFPVQSSDRCDAREPSISVALGAASPLRTIAMILAHGVLRLQQRQKDLDNRTEQRVHDHVLVTKEHS